MADETRTNPAINEGYEHRIGAKLHDYDYNNSIDKEDLVVNIRKGIDSLYTTSLDKQRAACGIRRVGGMMSDFKCDSNANAYYGFSMNSYTLKFPMKNVFWFNSLFDNRLNRHSTGYKRKTYRSDQIIKNPITARHRKFFSISEVYPTPINYDQNQVKSGNTLSHRIVPEYDSSGKVVNYYRYTESVSKTDPDVAPVLIKTERYEVKRSATGEVYYWKYTDGSKTPVEVYSLDEDTSNYDNFHIMYNVSDTVNRPDVFSHQLLFFIDGKLYTDLQMYVVPNYVIMVIDADRLGMSLSQVTEYTSPYYDYRWTILGLPFGNHYSTPENGTLLRPSTDEASLNSLILGDYTYRNVTYQSQSNLTRQQCIDFNTIDGIDSKLHYIAPDPNSANVYLTCYASNVEYVNINGKSNRQKTAVFDLALNTVDSYLTETITSTYSSPIPDTDQHAGLISQTDDNKYQWGISCLGTTANAYNSLGTNAIEKFNESITKNRPHDMKFIELKNVSSIINLGTNRIFQIGCSDSMPGPIPPENILIFKYNADNGLSLVHMVTSNYKENNLDDSEYGKLNKVKDKPVEDSIVFNPIEVESVYDYKSFIPTKDEYETGPDVNGTFTVTEYTDTESSSGYIQTTGETVTKEIITHREQQKYIELYFPNVFKLVGFNADDNLIAVIFYNKECNTGFDNPLATYMKFDPYYANNIVTGNLPNSIKEYIPAINRYTEDVYLNMYHINATRATEHQYKLEALRELVNDDYRRLINIYDRHYAKQNNKMHASIKYVIDLTKTSDMVDDSVKFNVHHFYKDQFTLQNKSLRLTYVDKIVDTSDGTVIPVNGEFEIYHDRDGGYLMDITDAGIEIESEDVRYQRVTMSGMSLRFNSQNLQTNLVNRIPKAYRLIITHRSKMKFPITVWVDGIRIDGSLYDISSGAFSTIIDINKNAIANDTKFVEIEIHKMKNINAKETIITLPAIHNSIKLDAGIANGGWEDISPQHIMVAIQQETMDDQGRPAIRYLVPSSYESWWLLFGHINYVEGYPTNANDEEREFVSINAYNVIKSMQGSYVDDQGRTIEKPDVALLADTNTLLIGETNETFNGNVDILKTFGADQYYKSFDTEEDRNEYVLMLREGFYSRDRRRFYDYLPMGKNDPSVYITPITEFFADKTVKIKNTDVYFSRTYTIQIDPTNDTTRRVTIENFQFDPSPFKYRVFMDGKLLDYDYDYISNVYLDDENFYMDSDVTLYLRKHFAYTSVHNIIFEYLPYKYQLVHRSIEYDGIITLTDDFIRPFDFRNFDVYVDGKLLTEDDIQVVTERRIIIKSIVNRLNSEENPYHPVVSIYEKMHDEDVFDYVWRDHKRAFDYIDHRDPTKTITHVDPDTGEVTTEVVDNVVRHPYDTNEFIDVKLAQRLKFSLDEQLIRELPAYKSFRMPSYDPSRSAKEAPKGFGS